MTMLESLHFREKKRPRREWQDVHAELVGIGSGRSWGTRRGSLELQQLTMPKLTERQQLALAVQESLACQPQKVSSHKKRESNESSDDSSSSDSDADSATSSEDEKMDEDAHGVRSNTATDHTLSTGAAASSRSAELKYKDDERRHVPRDSKQEDRQLATPSVLTPPCPHESTTIGHSSTSEDNTNASLSSGSDQACGQEHESPRRAPEVRVRDSPQDSTEVPCKKFRRMRQMVEEGARMEVDPALSGFHSPKGQNHFHSQLPQDSGESPVEPAAPSSSRTLQQERMELVGRKEQETPSASGENGWEVRDNNIKGNSTQMVGIRTPDREPLNRGTTQSTSYSGSDHAWPTMLPLPLSPRPFLDITIEQEASTNPFKLEAKSLLLKEVSLDGKAVAARSLAELLNMRTKKENEETNDKSPSLADSGDEQRRQETHEWKQREQLKGRQQQKQQHQQQQAQGREQQAARVEARGPQFGNERAWEAEMDEKSATNGAGPLLSDGDGSRSPQPGFSATSSDMRTPKSSPLLSSSPPSPRQVPRPSGVKIKPEATCSWSKPLIAKAETLSKAEAVCSVQTTEEESTRAALFVAETDAWSPVSQAYASEQVSGWEEWRRGTDDLIMESGSDRMSPARSQRSLRAETTAQAQKMKVTIRLSPKKPQQQHSKPQVRTVSEKAFSFSVDGDRTPSTLCGAASAEEMRILDMMSKGRKGSVSSLDHSEHSEEEGQDHGGEDGDGSSGKKETLETIDTQGRGKGPRVQRVGERRSGRVAALEMDRDERGRGNPMLEGWGNKALAGRQQLAQFRFRRPPTPKRACSGPDGTEKLGPNITRALERIKDELNEDSVHLGGKDAAGLMLTRPADAVGPTSDAQSCKALAAEALVLARETLARVKFCQDMELLRMEQSMSEEEHRLETESAAAAVDDSSSSAKRRRTSLPVGNTSSLFAGACAALLRGMVIARMDDGRRRYRSAAEGPVRGFEQPSLPLEALKSTHQSLRGAVEARHGRERDAVQGIVCFLLPKSPAL